jgi:predicted alternative tryptophan synthase beta-subunit
MEEIRRPLPNPEFQLHEIILPDTWMNIPFCLVKAFESTLDNESRQEDNFKNLQHKIFSMARLMDKQGMEQKTHIGL